jgi:hypothetical protein
MARILPENPLDKPLEEAVADAIASDLNDSSLHVLDPRDIARRAAKEGFRQGVDLSARTVGEMAADHDSDILSEAAKQKRTRPMVLRSSRSPPASRPLTRRTIFIQRW